METICEYEKCTGCFACQNVCPHKCIKLVSDKFGELHPQINQDLCIDCGLCIKKCPARTEPRWEVPIGCYAVWNKNEKDRRLSASGGVATCFSQYMIKNKNGIVYGVKWDKQLRPVFDKVTSISDLEALKGSKYVQAYVNFKYKEVDVDLQSGKNVLFIGTPCQIAGLKSFLGKDYDNLLTCDLLCHGVPSPKVWNLYLEDIRKRYDSEIEHIFFRDKSHGWKTFSLTFQSKRMFLQRRILTFDHYMQTFLRDISLRPSCYNCVCKKINRVSDVTLADFWGIRRINKAMNDDKGVSLVLLHSEKGKRLFQEIESDIEWYNESLASVKRINHNMVQSVKEPSKREAFFRNIDRYSFEELYDKTVRRGVMYELKNRIKGYLKLALHLLEI